MYFKFEKNINLFKFTVCLSVNLRMFKTSALSPNDDGGVYSYRYILVFLVSLGLLTSTGVTRADKIRAHLRDII